MDETKPHTVLQHWVSVGDLVILVASIVTTIASVGVTYGSLRTQVTDLTREVESLQQRDMTPGAATALASMREIDAAQDQAIRQMREDSIEFRREVRESLARIEAKLDQHDRE